MNISSTTVVLVNGKPARVLGSKFNQAVRKGRAITDEAGRAIIPSKNLTWAEVSQQLRLRKKVVAKVA